MSDGATLPDPPSAEELRRIGIRDDEQRRIDTSETWCRAHRTKGTMSWRGTLFGTWGRCCAFTHALPRNQNTRGGPFGTGLGVPGSGSLWRFKSIARSTAEAADHTGLRFTRPLSVLDLAADSAGAWVTRAGGIFAISTAPRVVTQRWARAVLEAFPNLDGVRYNSRFAGAACLALFSPARSSMPAQPLLSLPVTHPDLGVRLATAARRLGYQIV